MTLQGGGVLAITGTNTYTGATTVNASTPGGERQRSPAR